jgi:hypothetical protein
VAVLALIRRYERRRRFWRRVLVGGPDECWPWLGRTDRNGDGVHEGRPAPGYAYELAGRPLPSGASLELDRCKWAGPGSVYSYMPHDVR